MCRKKLLGNLFSHLLEFSIPLKRSRGRESVEEEGRSLGLSSRRYDLRERVEGRCVRRDVAECSRVISETRSSDTVADFGLAGIAAMSEQEDVHIGDGMMIDSDCEDDCVITGVRTVEQELALKGHEIVMVHVYVSVPTSSSATPSFALNPYSLISYESDPDEDEDPPVSPYVPEAIDHSPDSPFALLWEGMSPTLCFAADMRADAILTFDGGSTSGIQIPFCFIFGEDVYYPRTVSYTRSIRPWSLLVFTVESMGITRQPVC
ncbi:unnamed protein product [Arabidopsis thaliana]|uniref:Uncharacterized protein n=1 Tax=Arabidopsis thaliana TaxID=3702 RepID=A0A5S9WY01_ARATH|nr:unnamed protein product [Arabidopsis thaliana]